MKKIAILIPSRNRPRSLSAVITALNEMESGDNEVHYIVGVDEDDNLTPRAFELGGIPNVTFSKGNKKTIGAIWNYLAVISQADIYSCMIDDAFPISPYWDRAMRSMAEKFEAFSWHEISAPWNVGYPTCTRNWFSKVGYLVPEHFPFWFMDTWFSEMVQFVTNQHAPMCQELTLFSKQEATQNLRDLDFWWGFFNATRIIRLKEAHRITGEHLHSDLGDFILSRLPFVRMGENRDQELRGERLQNLEADRSAGKPSAKYLDVKEGAELYLRLNRLNLWGGIDIINAQLQPRKATAEAV